MEEKIIAALAKVSAKGLPSVAVAGELATLRYDAAAYEARCTADMDALARLFVVGASSLAEDLGGGPGVSYPSVQVKPVAQIVTVRLRPLPASK